MTVGMPTATHARVHHCNDGAVPALQVSCAHPRFRLISTGTWPRETMLVAWLPNSTSRCKDTDRGMEH